MDQPNTRTSASRRWTPRLKASSGGRQILRWMGESEREREKTYSSTVIISTFLSAAAVRLCTAISQSILSSFAQIGCDCEGMVQWSERLVQRTHTVRPTVRECCAPPCLDRCCFWSVCSGLHRSQGESQRHWPTHSRSDVLLCSENVWNCLLSLPLRLSPSLALEVLPVLLLFSCVSL